MSETKKVTDEELQSIKDLGVEYNSISTTFGQLKVQRMLLEQQISGLEETEAQLESRYVETQEKEREILKNINEKYGVGSLNPQTGEFTPREEAEKTEEKVEEN